MADQLDTSRKTPKSWNGKKSRLRSKQLIRSKRYAEAIELGHQLIERFPGTKQAETITELMPRLEQLLAKENAVTE